MNKFLSILVGSAAVLMCGTSALAQETPTMTQEQMRAMALSRAQARALFQQTTRAQAEQPQQVQPSATVSFDSADAKLPIAPKPQPVVNVPKPSAFPQSPQYSQDVSVGLFEVTTSDKTLREVVARWSTMNGWTHRPEHWAIDRDLPIAGAADAAYFGRDFKQAIRALLLSSELSDRPLQPCFYSNKVVRVVSKAELCDKNAQ